MMRIFYSFLLVLVFLTLVFFTLFGDLLYEHGKPVVGVAFATTHIGREDVVIPYAALRTDTEGNYVYILISEKGYSRTIYTVSRVKVEVASVDSSRETVTLSHSGVRAGDRVIIRFEGELEDNVRVVLE